MPFANLHRLLLVGEPLHGEHRPEHLGLDQLVVLVQVGDDRRLVEVAARADAVPAGRHPGVLGRPLDQARDVPELVGVVDRSVQDVLVVRVVAGLGVLGRIGQRGEELVVDAGLGDDPGRGGAVLAAVEEPGHGDALDSRLDVGVVEDHDRRLPAELEVGALEVLGGGRRHRDARRGWTR